MKCENDDCETEKDATKVLRLTSSHGELQNPFRIGNRTPARIGVCEDCAIYLCKKSELEWEIDGLSIEEFEASNPIPINPMIHYKEKGDAM